MQSKNITLSVLLISHNQADLIERCIESIVAQPIPFPYEIIMSDDHSSDGTWDIIQTYAAKYPESKEIDGLYTPYVIATQMNSDDYNPANKSMRGGWNRSHAAKYVHGKYLAIIDADDYYREGAHNFADQVAILDAHPECYACMENMYYLNKGEEFENATLFFPAEFFQRARIITPEEYIMSGKFMHTVAFLFRMADASLSQYGGRTADTIITSHFIQYGDIICYDSADYVYIQDKTSTAHVMQQTNDLFIVWGLGIYVPALIPALSHWYFLSHLDEIRSIVSKCRHNLILEESSKNFLSGMNVFVYDVFNRKRTITDKIRLHFSTWFIGQMIKHHWKSRLSTSILYKLIIR